MGANRAGSPAARSGDRRCRSPSRSAAESARPPSRKRKGRAAAGRHPPARPHARRHRARAGGGRGLRHRRAHPPGLDPLPPRQRGRRPARAGGDARQPRQRPDAVDRPRLQLFLASRQHRRRPASHPPQPRPCADEVGAAPGRARPRLPARRRSGDRRRPAARLLRSRLDQPGADRPSDRGAAQEHAHPRAGDRAADRRASRAWRATTSSWRATTSSCAA